MKSSKYRVIKFLELRLAPGTDALHRQAYDLGAMLLAAKGDDFYQRSVRDGASKSLRIVDSAAFQVDGKQYAGMLFGLVDRSLVDAAYGKIDQSATRSLGKDEDEGNRTEAHFLIDLNYTSQGDQQIYRCALEDATGLSPSQILGRLRPMLRRAGERSSKDAQGVKSKWSPTVNLEGLYSGDLFAEMASGTMGGFQLLKDEQRSGGIDEHDVLRRRKKILEIGLAQDPHENRSRLQVVKDSVAALVSLAKEEEWDSVKVQYTEAGTKRSHSVAIDPADFDDENLDSEVFALDRAVVRTARINLQEPMSDDHDEVVVEFLEKMAAKLAEQE